MGTVTAVQRDIAASPAPASGQWTNGGSRRGDRGELRSDASRDRHPWPRLVDPARPVDPTVSRVKKPIVANEPAIIRRKPIHGGFVSGPFGQLGNSS